jgi:hypothetical protein
MRREVFLSAEEKFLAERSLLYPKSRMLKIPGLALTGIHLGDDEGLHADLIENSLFAIVSWIEG